MSSMAAESLCSDSVCSSPRSVGVRGNDDEPRVRFMCSYGGRILPRPHDNQLRYVGGDTRIVAVSRGITYAVLIQKLSKLCGSNVTVKYQLPNEDLDSLISVTTDEDLENMMEEYDRLNSGGNRSSRLRLFLFPTKLESVASLGSLLDGSKREHWFLDALNGVPVLTRRRSEVSSAASEVPDYLFGLDSVDDWDREERGSKQGPGKSRLNTQLAEVHSAPESPVPMSSPYGSTSSAPPSIDTHVIAELAAKADKFALHPATSDAPVAAPEIWEGTQKPGFVPENQTTKLASKPDAEKSNNYLPEVLAFESQRVQIGKQEAPVEISPEDVKPVPSRSDLMTGSSLAGMKREGSGSNLSAYGEESRAPSKSPDGRNRSLQTDENYRPAPGVMTQQPQIPTDHYVEYTHPGHLVQQGQPASYWQMQEDKSGQVYYVTAGAATLVPRQPAYTPVQRIPAAYGADVHATGMPPVQKHAGAVSVPVSYPAKQAGKAPLYRAPTPRPVPMVMRQPPVPSSDQYAYQQFAYEAANGPPQQIYYTQRPTVMNPQYQPMMVPVAVDIQTSPETIPEGSVRARVSGSL